MNKYKLQWNQDSVKQPKFRTYCTFATEFCVEPCHKISPTTCSLIVLCWYIAIEPARYRNKNISCIIKIINSIILTTMVSLLSQEVLNHITSKIPHVWHLDRKLLLKAKSIMCFLVSQNPVCGGNLMILLTLGICWGHYCWELLKS